MRNKNVEPYITDVPTKVSDLVMIHRTAHITWEESLDKIESDLKNNNVPEGKVAMFKWILKHKKLYKRYYIYFCGIWMENVTPWNGTYTLSMILRKGAYEDEVIEFYKWDTVEGHKGKNGEVHHRLTTIMTTQDCHKYKDDNNKYFYQDDVEDIQKNLGIKIKEKQGKDFNPDFTNDIAYTILKTKVPSQYDEWEKKLEEEEK